MENYKRKAIELLTGLAVNEKKNPSVIPYIPAKTKVSENEIKSLPRRIGGEGHKYSKTLVSILEELEFETRANIHSLMIIKGGEVICEASHPGYDVNTFHLAHSMSKTVTGIAIGILIDEGKLSLYERVADIFPDIPYSDPRFADMTVENLLAMQSGVPFAEAGTVTEERWTETFFSSELKFAPGTSFLYNSMNSYILGKIVTRVSNMPLSEFVSERIFSPLCIDNFLWELGPEGSEKGGFGLYLSCESFAKIGLLLLRGGKYADKRIISEDFVLKMTEPHASDDKAKEGYDYGYHLWTEKDSSAFLLNGMLGQNVYVSPEHDIVVSVNAGNNEVFQDSPALAVIKKYIPCLCENSVSTRDDFKALKNEINTFFVRRHKIRPKKKIKNLSTFLRLKSPTPFDGNWYPVLGTYAFPDNNTGILPVFVSVFQNNYMGGIESFKLEQRGENLIFTSVEGGIAYEIPVGLYGYAQSIIDFKGEKYKVRAFGEAMEDEDRIPVYKIELIFPELPNTKMIKITHAPEGIRVRMSETPNQTVADKFISSFLDSGKMGFAMGLLEKKVGEDFITKKLTSLFNPEIHAIDTAIAGWQDIIESVNAELREKREGNNKFVKSLISKFIGEEKEEKQKEEKPKGEGFLSKAISALFSKFKGAGAADDSANIPFSIPLMQEENLASDEKELSNPEE